MTDLIERLRLGDGTSPDHLLLLEAADALEKSVECMCGICKLQPLKPLTDKQILADETLRYYFGQNGGAGPVSKQGRKVVDAIEAAHGIKENT
jgi:hypothetical protein